MKKRARLFVVKEGITGGSLERSQTIVAARLGFQYVHLRNCPPPASVDLLSSIMKARSEYVVLSLALVPWLVYFGVDLFFDKQPMHVRAHFPRWILASIFAEAVLVAAFSMFLAWRSSRSGGTSVVAVVATVVSAGYCFWAIPLLVQYVISGVR